MRGVFARSLGLSVGLFVAGAAVAERAGAADPTRPVVIAQSATAPAAAPAVQLGRPQPVRPGSAPTAPVSTITPVSYTPALLTPPNVVRAQGADEGPHRLPTGAAGDGRMPIASTEMGAVRTTSQKSDAAPVPVLSAPTPMPAPVTSTAPMPAPVASGPVLSGPMSVETPPGGMPCGDGCGPGECNTLLDWFDGCMPACGPMCCDGGTCPPRVFWASAEYLIWTIKDADLPPLVTTGPPLAPVPGVAIGGRLNDPGTAVLFGGMINDNEDRSGGRFNLGFWLDPSQCLGIEGSFLFLGERQLRLGYQSAGTPVLARPFFDVLLGIEGSQITAFPGVAAGTIGIASSTRLWGGEFNLRKNVCCCDGWKLDLLGGYRYMELDENLSINEVLATLSDYTRSPGAPPLPAGTGIWVTDRFSTRNFFNGGQVGVQAEGRWRRWFLNATGKVALGCTTEVVNINGMTTFVRGTSQSFQGGLLAQPSNIGRYSRTEFAVLPEAGLKIGYHLTPHLRLTVGYSILYWGQVARPGDQINRNINVSQLPTGRTDLPPAVVGPLQPAFVFNGNDFWAQGANIGLEYQW